MDQLAPSEKIRAALQRATTRATHQQETVVVFAQAALVASNIDQLLHDGCVAAARGLGTHFAKILKFLPEDNCLLLVAGVGWSLDEIGQVRLSADTGSPAGYAFAQGKPVLSNHLKEELRFRTPVLLERYGITRALNVPIRAMPTTFGVLEADSPDSDAFLESDIFFLESIANIIALSLERRAAEDADRDASALSTSVLNASTDCIKILSIDGRLQDMNESGLCQMEIDDFEAIKGRAWSEIWPDEARPAIDDALQAAAAGQARRFEAFCPTLKGESRWWDVSVSPILGRNNLVGRIVAVSRDVTERHANELRLEQLVIDQESVIGSNELLMREIHHRVRNSLQLVQTLLSLQASLSPEASAKSQLQTAALRVSTIGTVHQILYESDDPSSHDAVAYLRKLLDALSETFGDREVRLNAEVITLAPARLSPLGLVTTELVLNAVKYGRGRVTVSLHQRAGFLELVVDDEGHGFPENFPAPQGTGLGMRLVRNYSGFGREALEIDRSVSWSRIKVKFKTT